MDEKPLFPNGKAAARRPAIARRPWYRLHLSSWLVLLFALSGAALLILPGQEVRRWGDPGWGSMTDEYVAHGCPVPFLRRSLSRHEGPAAIAWHLTEGVEELHVGALVLDLGAAVTGIALLAWLTERRRRNCRFLQFRLCTLMIGLTVLAVGLAWWRNERAATDELHDHLSALQDPIFAEEEPIVPRFPAWIRSLVGDERLLGTGITKPQYTTVDWSRQVHANIKYLVDRFPERIVVRLQGTESDADLDLFFELTSLENLYISEPDERILSRLGQFKKLRFLVPGLHPTYPGTFVWQNPITDRGIAYLANLTQIEALEFQSGEFTDRGLVALRNLTNLEMLQITSRHVSDAALTNLADMPVLRQLSVAFSPITDVGLSHLTHLRRLERLDADGTWISDQGLRQLVSLPRLKALNLFGTGVTDPGVAGLKTSHPNPKLQVDYESESIDLARLADSISQVESGATNVLNVNSPKIHDANLSELGTLTNLTVLMLGSPFVSDATLARLESLNQLAELYLWYGDFTARGVGHLVVLRQLQMLSLPASKINEEMISSLQHLTSLRTLDVTDDIGDPDAIQQIDAKLKQALPRCEVKQY